MRLLLRALVALFKLIFRRRVKPLKCTSPGDPYRTAVEEDEVTLPSEPAPKKVSFVKRCGARFMADGQFIIAAVGIVSFLLVFGYVAATSHWGPNMQSVMFSAPVPRVETINGPGGAPAILLSGATGRQHLIKASKLCPRGYTVKLTVPETMLVRCKK